MCKDPGKWFDHGEKQRQLEGVLGKLVAYKRVAVGRKIVDGFRAIARRVIRKVSRETLRVESIGILSECAAAVYSIITFSLLYITFLQRPSPGHFFHFLPFLSLAARCIIEHRWYYFLSQVTFKLQATYPTWSLY